MVVATAQSVQSTSTGLEKPVVAIGADAGSRPEEHCWPHARCRTHLNRMPGLKTGHRAKFHREHIQFTIEAANVDNRAARPATA